MPKRTLPAYRAPVVQHLIFVAYTVAFYTLFLGGLYLVLDQSCARTNRYYVRVAASHILDNEYGGQASDWTKTIDVSRISGDEYRVQASLTPPQGRPNNSKLTPLSFDFPVTRYSDGRLYYDFVQNGKKRMAFIPEETVTSVITPFLKRFSLLIAVAAIFSLLGWIVILRLFWKAGYPLYYTVIPLVNIFYFFTLTTNGLLKSWLMFLGILVPGVNMVVWVLGCLGMAKNFGRSPGFGIGLLLAPSIFLPILAFGGSIYQPEISEQLEEEDE